MSDTQLKRWRYYDGEMVAPLPRGSRYTEEREDPIQTDEWIKGEDCDDLRKRNRELEQCLAEKAEKLEEYATQSDEWSLEYGRLDRRRLAAETRDREGDALRKRVAVVLRTSRDVLKASIHIPMVTAPAIENIDELLKEIDP